jgi:hypothetical protein
MWIVMREMKKEKRLQSLFFKTCWEAFQSTVNIQEIIDEPCAFDIRDFIHGSTVQRCDNEMFRDRFAHKNQENGGQMHRLCDESDSDCAMGKEEEEHGRVDDDSEGLELEDEISSEISHSALKSTNTQMNRKRTTECFPVSDRRSKEWRDL